MQLDLWMTIALVEFALVTSITPGPNNMMLLSSGANFGFRRSLPHMFGIGVGFVLMVALVGIGLAQVFERFPQLNTILSLVCIAYLLWLAWKIGNSGSPEARANAQPMTFLQAAAFQWVNPKAWGMALTATTTYAPDHSIIAACFVALVFGIVNLPSVSLWCLLGQSLQAFLGNPTRLRLFNWVMAALLVASVIPAVLDLAG